MAVLDRQAVVERRKSFTSEEQFLIRCLTAKGIGLWAAEKLELTDTDAVAYAQQLAIETLAPEDVDFVRRLRIDFESKGLMVSDRKIAQMVDQQRILAEEKVSLRYWMPDVDGQVPWERRRSCRYAVGPLELPPVLKDWVERHPEWTERHHHH